MKSNPPIYFSSFVLWAENLLTEDYDISLRQYQEAEFLFKTWTESISLSEQKEFFQSWFDKIDKTEDKTKVFSILSSRFSPWFLNHLWNFSPQKQDMLPLFKFNGFQWPKINFEILQKSWNILDEEQKINAFKMSLAWIDLEKSNWIYDKINFEQKKDELKDCLEILLNFKPEDFNKSLSCFEWCLNQSQDPGRFLPLASQMGLFSGVEIILRKNPSQSQLKNSILASLSNYNCEIFHKLESSSSFKKDELLWEEALEIVIGKLLEEGFVLENKINASLFNSFSRSESQSLLNFFSLNLSHNSLIKILGKKKEELELYPLIFDFLLTKMPKEVSDLIYQNTSDEIKFKMPQMMALFQRDNLNQVLGCTNIKIKTRI